MSVSPKVLTGAQAFSALTPFRKSSAYTGANLWRGPSASPELNIARAKPQPRVTADMRGLTSVTDLDWVRAAVMVPGLPMITRAASAVAIEEAM